MIILKKFESKVKLSFSLVFKNIFSRSVFGVGFHISPSKLSKVAFLDHWHLCSLKTITHSEFHHQEMSQKTSCCYIYSEWSETWKNTTTYFQRATIYVPRKTKGPRVYSVLLNKSNQMNNLNPPFFSSRFFLSFFLETAWTTESFSNLFSPSQICAINLGCNKTKEWTFLSNFIVINSFY